MDSIAQYVNEEKDALYLRGQKKEQIKFVTNLLLDTDFSTEKVSQIAGVSVDFVMDVKQKLSGQK